MSADEQSEPRQHRLGGRRRGRLREQDITVVDTATVDTANGGRVTVAVSESRDEMAVDTRDLPALDAQHVYQIWTVHGSDMVSAAILSDPESGAAMGLPNGATEVAMTVEPSGGSEQPTTAPIIQLDPYDVLES